MNPDLNLTHTFLLLVNEGMIAFVLEGPTKGEILFVCAVDADYWTPNEDDDNDGEDEYYKDISK